MRALRLEPDQIFAGAYRVQRLLGKGSMGVVYLAESLGDGQKYALKLLTAEALRDERALDRFDREVTVSQQVQSDHIVKTLAAGVEAESQQPWLVMEYVDGQHLDAFIEDNPDLDDASRHQLLHQLFEGIAAVHAAGFVHRDLKPENLFVRRTDAGLQVKILDFGVTKRLGVSPNNSTAQGIGTPLWTAPEQATSSRGLAPSADVWALGLLAFFTLTDKIYWLNAHRPKAGVLELIIEISKSTIDPASERAKTLDVPRPLPPGFDDWFARSVHRDPSSRFADATEAHSFLTDVLEGRLAAFPPRLSQIPPPSVGAQPAAKPATATPLPRTSRSSPRTGPLAAPAEAPLPATRVSLPDASPPERASRPDSSAPLRNPLILVVLGIGAVLLFAAIAALVPR